MSSTVKRIYSNFRGVDFRGEEINLRRSPDSKNVWKDYTETESIRTRPSLEHFWDFGDPIWGIFFFRDETIIHCGCALYSIKNNSIKTIHSNVDPSRSNAFVYEDKWYFMDGVNYLVYNGGENAVPVEGYIPTTTIGASPNGAGKAFEDVNMLTGLRKNSFYADGTSTSYHLDARELDEDYEPMVWVNDEPEINFTVDYEQGIIEFDDPPPVRMPGQDNVLVQFSKTRPEYLQSILGCTLVQMFDNRVFVSGNPNYPNVVWHCSLDNPAYFSDYDYYQEGLDNARIRGMVAGNNGLWVFREPSDANTTVFYHTPSNDSEYGKIYPSAHSSVTTGCIGKAINFGDDIVFFSDRGMEGISGDITTEQILAHRSTTVDRRMIAEHGYRDMVLAEWNGYLMVFIGNKVYLADSRAMFTNENHYEYEWFYWELEVNVRSAKVHDGVLYIGTDDAVYKLTGSDDVESYWTTPKDKFENPHMLKTTNKRGCVAEATTGTSPYFMGEVSVYAKTENTEFELIETHYDVKDYFVSRIKRKKFKDIQLKFYSPSRFSLETVTLEAFIGGYVKR